MQRKGFSLLSGALRAGRGQVVTRLALKVMDYLINYLRFRFIGSQTLFLFSFLVVKTLVSHCSAIVSQCQSFVCQNISAAIIVS